MVLEIDLDLVEKHAMILAGEDRRMRKELVAIRRRAGLTQQDVADTMGMSEQAVQHLERYDSDPSLSTLRRYAITVGALVKHTVSSSDDHALWAAGCSLTEHSPRKVFTLPVSTRPVRTVTHAYREASSTPSVGLTVRLTD